MVWPFNKIFNKSSDSTELPSAESVAVPFEQTQFFTNFKQAYPSSDMWVMVGIPTVLQCVTILANGISQVPFKIYHKEGRLTEEAKEHQLHRLLSYKPNNYQSEYEFMDNIGLRLALQGEVVVWIIKIGNMVRQLIPFGMDRVRIDYTYDKNGFPISTYVLTKPNGTQVSVPEKDIWHIRRRTFASYNNIPYADLITQTLDLAVAEVDFLGSSYKNGARPSGIVTAKAALSDEQINKISQRWKTLYGGATNAHQTIVLGAELDYKAMSFSNADSQQLENRQHMISEICRLFNVNPFMVFEYTNNSSYSSSEQMMLNHLVHTLAPIYRMIESGFKRNVMTEEDIKKGYYVKFKEDALMRLDHKTRAEVTQLEINTGIRTINEERAFRELPPIEGGDVSIVQGAMIPLKDVGKAYDINSSTNNSQEGEEPSSSQESEGINND